MVIEKLKKKGKAEETDPLVSDGLHPDPKELLKEESIDLEVLRRLKGQSVVSVRQFDKELVIELCKFAAMLEATDVGSTHPLDGKIVITAFFEASTRTRLRSEEHTSELQSLMRISYAVFC